MIYIRRLVIVTWTRRQWDYSLCVNHNILLPGTCFNVLGRDPSYIGVNYFNFKQKAAKRIKKFTFLILFREFLSEEPNPWLFIWATLKALLARDEEIVVLFNHETLLWPKRGRLPKIRRTPCDLGPSCDVRLEVETHSECTAATSSVASEADQGGRRD